MDLRLATSDDLPAIATLHAQSWRRAYAGLIPDDLLLAPVEAEMRRRWATLPSGADFVWVATNPMIVGFAHVIGGHPEGPLLESLHVDHAVQGQRIGRALMRAVAQTLHRAGQDNLWLEVLQGNHAARAIYAHLGGQEGPLKTNFLMGHPIDEYAVFWPKLDRLLAG